MSKWIYLIITCCCLVHTHAAGPSWAHSASPYRAEIEITSQPNHTRCGYWLHVPVCGTGDPDGKDISVFTSKGKRLPIIPVGASSDNTVLVMCGDRLKDGEKVYAYWGSKRRDLKNTTAKMLLGLTVDIRTCDLKADIKDWRASSRQLKKSTRIGIVPMNQIVLSDNPIDRRDAFIMDFNGHLNLDQGGKWTLFLNNDDAGYVFINDSKKPLIDRSGSHWGGDNRTAKDRTDVGLKSGLNSIRVVVIDTGGEQMAVLARVSKKRSFALPPTVFIVGGRSKVLRAESRNKRQGCPAFTTRTLNFMSIQKNEFSMFELRSLSGEDLTWKLSNGQDGKSSVFHQIAIGSASIDVEIHTNEGAKGFGKLQLSSLPWQASWHDRKHYDHYANTMMAQGLHQLSAEYLDAYFYFMTLTERNPHAAKLAQYLLKNPQKAKRNKAGYYLAIAEGGEDPELAHDAYAWLTRKAKTHAKRKPLLLQYLDHEFYRRRKADGITQVLQQVRKAFGANSATYRRCLAEQLLLAGNVDKARALIGELRTAVMSQYTTAMTAQANNQLELHKRHASSGYYEKADQALQKWVEMDPDRMLDGHYALVKARYLRKLNATEGAYNLLTRTLEMTQLPAFLPDMQLERGQLLRELKRKEEADAILQSIVKEYPMHPVAQTAMTLLEQK